MAVPIDSVMLPEVEGESYRERWKRFGHNNTALIVQCVQESTRETYAVGWRRWIAFNNWFGTDPWLRAPPLSWNPVEGGTPLKFKDFVAVSFMQQLCNAEKLCPGTVGVYMSGVRHHLRVANQDISFLESPGSALDECIVCVKEFMTVCMARVSEAIPGKPNVTHWLREDDRLGKLHLSLWLGLCPLSDHSDSQREE